MTTTTAILSSKGQFSYLHGQEQGCSPLDRALGSPDDGPDVSHVIPESKLSSCPRNFF